MTRQADHPIAPYLLDRHSRIALSDTPVTEAQLWQLFEAARWAPSASNSQPWRFVYALRGTPEFSALFDALAPFNQAWGKQAGALVAILSQRVTDDGKVQNWHAFDAGAAWMSMSLQGAHIGLLVHAMGGFDAEKTRGLLDLPENYALHAMMFVGVPGKTEDLPEAMQVRDRPNNRHPIATRVAAGRFPTSWRPLAE